MSASVLVDASNLMVGGGVQVGASFVDVLASLHEDPEVRQRWSWIGDVVVEASDVVIANQTAIGAGLPVEVVDGRPAARLRRRLDRADRRAFDVSFTVFGPDYGPRRARKRVVGFADVTSLFPEFAGIRGRRARLRHAARRRVSRRLFRSADLLVTESSFVSAALTERWGIPAHRVKVVPNVLNQVFRDEARQLPVQVELPDVPLLAFPTRPYPHKNLAVLGAAEGVLREEHGRSVRFALTLTPEEWQGLDPATRAVSVNVGPLMVGQMPGLYAACAGVVFPSLNECFSVTPLEAMMAARPLLASDRAFVREVAGEAAWYFEPTEPASLARALAEMLGDEDQCARRVAVGKQIADGWPTANDRATAYLDIIEEALGSGAATAR
ncbi:MAG: glycosyltransferase [Nocardioides sp.]|uniref:glycosyltransferase n=1 Tax=Nocardioides sp. TaxID=35761 RepID=UPI003263DE55